MSTQWIPFEQVRDSLQPGAALPWNVRNATGALLLAKGHVVSDPDMLTGLIERGAFVDAEELAREKAENPMTDGPLSQRWAMLEARLGTVLRSSAKPNFLQRIREALGHLLALSTGNTHEIIYLILRHDHSVYANYGVAHSLHVAALCAIVTRRMEWPQEKRASLVGAALTMNLSILDLQGTLSANNVKPTPAERQMIDEHPLAAARILRDAGLDDEDWLTTVEQHHEAPGGTGYPRRVEAPTEMSQLLRFIDIYSAKHSPRANRKPLPAHQAARELFLQGNGNPLASLLIKELGIYPPGTYVKLVSGEIGIVTEVGTTAKTPIVAAITNKQGDPLGVPVRRDSSQATHAIQEIVAENLVKVRVTVQELYER